MLRSLRTKLRNVTLVVAALIILATTSCRPDLLVRLTTRVFHDGSFERRLEVIGRNADGEVPTEPDWLVSEVGLRLADPDAWGRVEQGPDRLSAEGFFLDAASLPSLLAYSTEEGARVDRVRTQLEIDRKVVLRRWAYREFHGDPFGREETERALDELIGLLAEALEAELRRQFGDGLDPAPAGEVLRFEVRSLALALITVGRTTGPMDGPGRRAELWSRILAQHGVPTAPLEDPAEFWDRHTPLLVDWSRRRIAQVISTRKYAVAPDDLLPFWPDRADPYPRLEQWLETTWDDPGTIEGEIESHANVIAGYYGRETAPRFRFEISLALPGTLLTTNGTPDGDSVRWLLRNDDMSLSDFVLRAESVELIDESLVALGARRQFDTGQRVHLADLLWKRDTEGVLADLLEEAVRQGRLDLVLQNAPEEHAGLARELADLLDPETEP